MSKSIGEMYNERPVFNKILLHLYVLFFMILPVTLIIMHVDARWVRFPFGDSPLFFLALFIGMPLYLYAFAIRYFPMSNLFILVRLFLPSILNVIFLILFLGFEYFLQIFMISGAMLLGVVLILSVIFYFPKLFKSDPSMDRLFNHKPRWLSNLYLVVLGLFVVAWAIFLLVEGFNCFENIFQQIYYVFALIGLAGSHYRFLKS